MTTIEQEFTNEVEGKIFEPVFVMEFDYCVSIPDVPIFEQLIYKWDRLDFERTRDKNRMVYNITGRSHHIAELFMQYGIECAKREREIQNKIIWP